jgi:hypothetical protein
MAGFWSWLAKVVCCSSRSAPASATTDGPRDPELLSNQWVWLSSQKFLIHLSHQMFRHMHGVLNVDEKKLITQFDWKS